MATPDRNEYARSYYAKNRTKRLAYQRAWRQKNMARVRKQERERYDPAKQRTYNQHYRAKDPEAYAALHRKASLKYYSKHRQEQQERHKRWAKENAESVTAYRRKKYAEQRDEINAKRRAQRAANPQPSRDQEMARHRSLKQRIVEALGGRCSGCGYNKNPHVLNIHHKGEKLGKQDWKKKDGMSRLPYLELLCANCHQERHHPVS